MKPLIHWPLLKTKVRLSVRSLAWLLGHARYAVITLVVAAGFFELVYWMLKPAIFWTLMSSSVLSFGDKAGQLFGPFTYVFVQNGWGIALLMFLLALTQGIAVAAVIYIMRHQPKVDETLLGKGAAVSFIALIGLGCPACGTSLITPLVAMFASGSALALSQIIARIILPIALVIGLYGLYTIGLQVSTIRAHSSDTAMRRATLVSRLVRNEKHE